MNKLQSEKELSISVNDAREHSNKKPEHGGKTVKMAAEFSVRKSQEKCLKGTLPVVDLQWKLL